MEYSDVDLSAVYVGPSGGITWGPGMINADPQFADPDHGDYHLKSVYGRYDPTTGSWVADAITSPAIDAGDPAAAVGDEPKPNGARINLGAYAGTAEASKSAYLARTGISLCDGAVAENLPAGTVVGTLVTSDVDLPSDLHTYALVPGTGDGDNGLFAIVGDVLKTLAVFDYETKSGYSIRVRTTDAGGLWYEEPLAVAVSDVDEIPPALTSLTPLDNSTDVAVDTSLVLTFNEAVQKGTGNVMLKRAADGAVVETIPVDGAAVTVAGNTVTIARSVTLEVLREYYVEVTAGALEDLAGNEFAGLSGPTAWSFATPTFRVMGLLPTASGLVATFNAPLATTDLKLYDGAGGALGPSDLSVLDGTGEAVAGSLVVGDSLRSVEWVATGTALPPGTYTVTLKSGATAFHDGQGHTLDGDTDETSGGDFSTQFTVAAGGGRVVSIPDLARGAGQSVHVPNAAAGLPIRIDNADGVTSLAMDVFYDKALLSITGGALATGVPGDWSLTVDTRTPGVAKITASGATPLTGTNVELVRLTASVPGSAPYGAVRAIHLENISLNGGAIAAVGDVAVHKAVYLGDADGSGIHSSADAFLTVQAALGLASGFAAHPWTDPRIVGDADGSGTLSAADAFLIVQEGLGLVEPFVPDNPHITVTPVGAGVDPQFQIDVDIPATVGSWVTVPVKLGIEAAATNVGAVDFDLFFDPARLTIQVPGGVSAGADTAGWAVSAILVSPGQLRVGMVSFGGRPLAVGLREIVRLQFRVDASAGSAAFRRLGDDRLKPALQTPVSERAGYVAALDIEPVDPRGGGYTWTAVDGSLRIAPATDMLGNVDPVFGYDADGLTVGEVRLGTLFGGAFGRSEEEGSADAGSRCRGALGNLGDLEADLSPWETAWADLVDNLASGWASQPTS